MPVALTDHPGRNPEKNLLRGRTGYVESWILDDREGSMFDEQKRILKYPSKPFLFSSLSNFAETTSGLRSHASGPLTALTALVYTLSSVAADEAGFWINTG
eukprot:2951255-Karenia_brevis.AAC.1